MADFPPLTPVPLCYLTQKGDLVSATDTCQPATLALGSAGQVLTANPACPTGLDWAGEHIDYLPCSLFNNKGDILVDVGLSQNAAVALPVGNQNQRLVVDDDSPYGLSWQNPEICYTGKGQLLVGDKDRNYTTIQGCQGAILQWEFSNPIRWTATCGTEVYTKQEGFKKGSLAIGIGPDQFSQFAVGPDDSVLTVCSTNVFGVQWVPQVVPNPINTDQVFSKEGCSPLSCFFCEVIPATAFGEGCTVYAEINGELYLCGDRFNCGKMQMCQGTDCSYLFPYGNISAGGNGACNCCHNQYKLTYVIQSWNSNCGLCMVVWPTTDGGTFTLRADALSFAL